MKIVFKLYFFVFNKKKKKHNRCNLSCKLSQQKSQNYINAVQLNPLVEILQITFTYFLSASFSQPFDGKRLLSQLVLLNGNG